MTPLVSILIPAHNAAPWIAQTLRSALAQTYHHIEVIVVDDGSIDGTLDIVRAIHDDRITVASRTQHGAANARNFAFDICHGDYIQWLDADDLLSPDKIARQMAMAADPSQLLSCRWGSFFHCPDRAIFTPSPLWSSLTPVDYLRRKLSTGAHMQPATWLVSRALTESVGPWDESLTLDDDGEYFSRVVKHSTGITFVPNVSVYYRQTGRGLSRVTPAKLRSLLSSMLSQIADLEALDNSNETRIVVSAYLRVWAPDFAYTPEMLRELRQLAAECETDLDPLLRRKYRWLLPLLGLTRTARLQHILPALRAMAARALDGMICRMRHQH